ncbi:hypothetical protein BDZ97DRAFT_1803342 [Flammula alnicola]|nr:hypothetical protein BDZ97DRAFT_1803342 [Flammula alnicola]
MSRGSPAGFDGSDGPHYHQPQYPGQRATAYCHCPAPSLGAWAARGENESLLGAPNSRYGTTELGQIHTRLEEKLGPSKIIFYIASLLTFGAALGYFLNEPLNAARHDSIRRQWAREESDRTIIRQAWAAETQEHEELQLRMHRDIILIEARRTESEVRWEAERTSMEAERREWAREREQHARRIEEERRERARRIEEERREHARRIEEERREQIRKRERITWDGLEPRNCLRYGVKEYTATLAHVPLGFDAIEECSKKSVMIHGKEWLPYHCENQGICGRATGHWQVDVNEASCSPWWSYFKDKGCVESGIRRHEAPLENLPDDANWEVICSTTPANIGGMHYGGPTSCVNWGQHGIWGIWLVNDNTCR